MLLASSYRLVMSVVDSNPRAFITGSLFPNIIMAQWRWLVFRLFNWPILSGRGPTSHEPVYVQGSN